LTQSASQQFPAPSRGPTVLKRAATAAATTAAELPQALVAAADAVQQPDVVVPRKSCNSLLRHHTWNDLVEQPRPTMAREAPEAFALVKVLGTFVLHVDLEIHGSTSGSGRGLECSPEHRSPDSALALVCCHEELIEPRYATSVLQGPRVGENGDSDGLRIVSNEHSPAARVGQKAEHGLTQALRGQVDLVLLELRANEAHSVVEGLDARGFDLHLPHFTHRTPEELPA
jgi:hypothetical protein